jgi:hypothetical protein
MKKVSDLGRTEIVDLLNRCWMAHDGMWFLHCFQAFGIDEANRLNKSAIRSLAPLEIAWMRKALGAEGTSIGNFSEFKNFFISASQLVIPDFMGAKMSFPAENRMHWEFEPSKCFAYRGMKRIGAIEGYACGVIYRIECWFEALGLRYKVMPRPLQCRMLGDGTCSGDFEISFD